MAAISRPSILVTNDDGIDSEGIAALAQALGRVGQVRVVAPRQEMSASSHSISLSRPLRYEQVKTDWYAVHGTPADAVIMALNHIIPEMPDMVFSGINKGSNLGQTPIIRELWGQPWRARCTGFPRSRSPFAPGRIFSLSRRLTLQPGWQAWFWKGDCPRG